MSAIDARARAALDAYLRAIEELRETSIESVWLYGSVVLEAYSHGRSDVDVVTVVEEPLGDEALRDLHFRAHQFDSLASAIQALYVRRRDLSAPWRTRYFPLVGPEPGEPPYPRGELLPSTRACIHQVGRTLKGVGPAHLLPLVDARDLREEMLLELDWFVSKTSEPDLFLHDYWVDHATGMAARILATLETGAIVGKPAALPYLARHQPQWESVAAECASRIGEDHELRPQSHKRARAVIEMVRDVRDYARRTWPLEEG